MKIQKSLKILLIAFVCTMLVNAQQAPTPAQSTFEQLKAAYTGEVTFDAASKTVTFTTSGTIAFAGRKELTDNIWHIPPTILKVYIKAGVQVTGEFAWGHIMTFEGEDQKTSVVYGTSVKGALNAVGLDKLYSCVAYSAFYGYGTGDNFIKNLTCLNPLGFMFTGKNSCRLHLDGVRGIDNRGGVSNHSDGISAASGSTVKNCYLETGDDAIKVYANILVENTEIVMIQNCVPIQYGWGTYGSGAVGTFKKVYIHGSSGRSSEKFVINMASTSAGAGYNKTIVMDSCTISNATGTLFSMGDNSVASNVTITNSKIDLKAFGTKFGTGKISICGTSVQSNTYNCLDVANGYEHTTLNKPVVYPNPFSQSLTIHTANRDVFVCDMAGNLKSLKVSSRGSDQFIETSQLPPGVYYVVDKMKRYKVVKF